MAIADHGILIRKEVSVDFSKNKDDVKTRSFSYYMKILM